jgi:hypothetical protein
MTVLNVSTRLESFATPWAAIRESFHSMNSAGADAASDSGAEEQALAARAAANNAKRRFIMR